MFDADRLPSVFQDVEEDDFSGVEHAIEERSSHYDEAEEDEDEAGDFDDLIG